ncbi:MAG: hypothetical protein RLY35_1987 [Bacteroidota bacterium]
MNFDITILGCGAATPTLRLRPTAQVVSVRDHYFLLDCGEGTQTQLRQYGIKMQRIEVIFISHLHGDHIYGLIGLLSTYSLLGRIAELTIVGPPELKEWLNHTFKISETYLSFPLHFVPTGSTSDWVWENDFLRVKSVPVKHRMACHAFLFEEKPLERKIIKSYIGEKRLTLDELLVLKKDLVVTREDGEVIHPDSVCSPRQQPRKYFFCTDTLPLQLVDDDLMGIDLLYHEATFLEEHVKRAKETHHSTARQAAEVAQYYRAGKLLLGHFSARYSDLSQFESEAKVVFERVECAEEGKKYSIPINESR